MRNPRWVLALVVASMIGVVAATVWTKTSPVQAQHMGPKWEYCAITQIYLQDNGQGGSTAVAEVSYLGPSGNRTEKILTSADGDPLEWHQIAFYKITAKLGNEGWEVVGRLNINSPQDDALFFKRQK